MGLDNGFELRNKKTKEKIEIVYWRKHWDYREAVFETIEHSYNEEQYGFIISAEDIPAIIQALKPYLNYNYWLNHKLTIWDFNSAALRKDIRALRKAYKKLKKEPNDYELIFYDSY